jgi:hypothetical protein
MAEVFLTVMSTKRTKPRKRAMTQEFSRTIYRCTYVFKGELGPVRDSRAFQTEQEARSHADSLQARGYGAVVWRERQVKTGGRWEIDLHDPLTQPLDD